MKASLLLCALLSAPAWSHSGSTAFLDLSADGNSVHGEWLLSLRDLEQVVGIDENQDAQLTWGEIVHRLPAASAYARANLHARAGAENCVVTLAAATPVELDGTAYLRWPLFIECPDRARPATLNYTALFAHDATHRAIVKWRDAGASSPRILVFAPQRQIRDIPVDSPSAANHAALIGQGVIHILEGYDHLLFLLALLLPIILAQPLLTPTTPFAKTLRKPLRELLKVITAFTGGHSITLAIATLWNWSPPSRWVEVAIAMTVIVAGVNIARPLFRDGSWRVAALFGLIHGFGFASALRELDLPRAQLALSLLDFNLGVEAGQLLVVALACPLLLLMARLRSESTGLRHAASLSIVAVGGLWLAQRIVA